MNAPASAVFYYSYPLATTLRSPLARWFLMGACLLLFCTAVLAVGKFRMGLEIETLRTLALAALVFGSEATLYSIRERRRLWNSRPSLWVVVSTACDILIISTLVTRGP